LGGSGDGVADLQQAVSNYYGFQPQPDAAPQADLASNNSFMSPTTNITDDHSVSFGMGDITLGDKTTAQGDGAVAVGGSTHGDIVSGDGAVLGNGNTVNNGDVHTGAGSTITVGNGDSSAGGNVLSSHDGTVIQTSGHGSATVSDGNTTNVHGNQTITDIHGTGNTSGVDNSTTLTHTTAIDNSEHDSSTHSIVDTSVHDSSIHDTSLHDNSIHETTHTDTGLDAHLGF
jgi:hypothetical protein